MKRFTLVALAAAVLLATMALAATPELSSASHEKRFEYLPSVTFEQGGPIGDAFTIPPA